MRYTLTVDIDNAAFSVESGDDERTATADPRAVAARLFDVAARINTWGVSLEVGDNAPVHDVNGNRVGAWYIDTGTWYIDTPEP